MRARATTTLVWLLLPVCLSAGEAVLSVDAVLDEMAAKGAKFDPEALVKMGPKGLSALLDQLLPETAAPRGPRLSRQDVLRLIKGLGADDYRAREQATAKLIEMGRPFEELVATAARDEDPEIRVRAESVLAAWREARQEAETRDVARYALAFGVYVGRLADDACLLELARRTRAALEKGAPAEGKLRILQHCLRTLAQRGNDRYCDPLKPLLKHADASVAVLVTRSLGSCSANRYFPSLLLDALRSDREAVVDAAIDWTPNCWGPRRREVRRLLRKVFDGENETLKFQACFPLMHDYGDTRAVAYLLSQTRSKDAARARRAVSWLGDSCNRGKPVSPGLLEALVPLLKSGDNSLRRRAADALGTYSGEAVVKKLIPLLADKQAIIVSETRTNLLEQRDKAMVQRLLAEAQKTAPNPVVRERAGELLAKLRSGR